MANCPAKYAPCFHFCSWTVFYFQLRIITRFSALIITSFCFPLICLFFFFLNLRHLGYFTFSESSEKCLSLQFSPESTLPVTVLALLLFFFDKLIDWTQCLSALLLAESEGCPGSPLFPHLSLQTLCPVLPRCVPSGAGMIFNPGGKVLAF